MAERLARKSQDGTLGQQTEMHEDRELEKMNLNVGDTYNSYDSQETDTGWKGMAIPLILAAALAGGGLGMGAMALLKDDAPVMEDTDTDTRYQLRISTSEAEPPGESQP